MRISRSARFAMVRLWNIFLHFFTATYSLVSLSNAAQTTPYAPLPR